MTRTKKQRSGPAVAGAAHRRSRSNLFRSTGMVLKQRRACHAVVSVVCHSGHGCHLPRGIGPCSPRSNPTPGRAGVAITPVAATAGY